MNKKANALGLAIAATLGAGTAEAATYTATLIQVAQFSGSGSAAGNISSSTATWSYDDVTGLLSQTGGTFNIRHTIVPTVTLYRHSITGLVIGAGAVASATSFACAEGNFGANVGASLCGNYNFGANLLNESTVSWGPGTAFARALGGDDAALGPQQNVSAYDYFSTVSWVGTTLILSNASCMSPPVTGCATTGGFTVGQTWTLSAGPQAAVPVPAAAWLFGSALAALGAARRRQA